jgi:CubicO group peptidase (beta-lactamase class C family)
VGEVVRRVSGRSLGTFFHDELAVPLGADFWIGLPASEDQRVANVIPPMALPPGAGPDSMAARAMGNPPIDATKSWTTEWRRAELPAANGHGNARSVARVQSVLSHSGEIDGHRYLSPAGCDVVFRQQAQGVDLVLGAPLTLGMGYGINSTELPVGPNPRTCFWGGWGGSIVVNDLDARMTIAYVMNRMGEGTLGDTRGLSIAMAAYGALDS